MSLDQLAAETAVLGIPITDEQLRQFEQYLALLLTWNERLNLTAVRDSQAIQRRHFLDSLSCCLATGDLNGRRLIDVGSGAGFPGLPLKIIYPHMRLTIAESVAKKTDFLRAVVAALSLAEVEVVAERAEVLGQAVAYREQYDWAVARGVAEMRVLVEYLLPLCRPGGAMLAQKGGQAVAETAVAQNAIALLGGGEPAFYPVHLPQVADPHFLVVVPKVRATPPNYPRRPGMPGKRPL